MPQEDAYSIIQRQAERIATLEARLARSEPVSSSLEHRNGQYQAINSPKPLSSRFDDHILSDMEENRRPPDTVAIGGEDAFVFRGKGFKTQFYGPSSPMSAVLNSHLILKFVGVSQCGTFLILSNASKSIVRLMLTITVPRVQNLLE